MEYENAETAKGVEVIEDDTFSYDGYQVVRGEFFAHLKEPVFTLSNNRISISASCLSRLPDTEYVQVLVNADAKKLAVRPCSESEKDSFRWCTGGKKKMSRHIKCDIFYAKIMSLMNWNPEYRYRLLGKLVQSKNELLFIFDLTSPSVYIKVTKSNGKINYSRDPSFPEEWKNRFGLSVSEHRERLQINMFDGMTVFALAKPESRPQITHREEESQNAEQQSLNHN